MATPKTRRVFEVDVSADPNARKVIRQINTQLRSMEGAAKKTQREVTRMSKGFNLMSIAAKGYIALRIATAITDTSDAMILLGARLNIVTEDTVGVNQAFDDLFDVAEKTRQSIGATGTLYARLGFATKALKLDHEDLLDIVQGVNNTLLLSGASAQESASSIIQLSQAFSKGSLDGDEFRSVSEGNVILFGIMQDVLGKTAGELRQFSRDGKLSADVLAKVLTSDQIKLLQSRVDEIPFTFAQAFTLVQNELSKLAIYFEDTFTAITEEIVEMLADLNTLVRFIGALNDGLIDFDISKFFKLEFRTNPFDVMAFGLTSLTFDMKALNAEMLRIKPIQESIKHDAKTGATVFRDAIKLLNDELNKSIQKEDRLRKSLDNIKDLNVPIAQDNIAQKLAIQLKLQDGITVAINANAEAIRFVNEEYDKGTKQIEEWAKSGYTPEQQKEFDKLAKSVRTPLQIMNDELAKLKKFQGLGFEDEDLVISAATTKSVDDYHVAMKKLKPELTDAEKRSKEFSVAIGQTLADGISSAADSLYDFALGLETSFSDSINNMLNDIGRLITKLILLRAIEESLSGSPVGNFLWPEANAKGNVFNNGDVTAFATGGVIDQPTFFPMNSGVGLLGEEGPEAILPLKRGAGGQLGVTVEGGAASNVAVSIENKGGNASQIVESSATTDINGTVISIVLDDLRRGGPIRDSVRSLGEYG